MRAMARYEHLPIYRAAFDLAVHVEKFVRGFTRCHKYSLGSEMRERSREILARIIDANHSRDRAARLEQLRGDLENFKVMVRLCHESGGFASTRGGCGRPSFGDQRRREASSAVSACWAALSLRRLRKGSLSSCDASQASSCSSVMPSI